MVFMSTCDGVDYHEALFTEMTSILSNDNDNDDDNGIFGKACPIYKLHGNVPHAERNTILRKFGQGANGSSTNGRAALLLATDVAARGLNLPGVDWTVQYDPPCEVADYAHRAGRAARAGKGGHSLLFLLPSERAFLDVLEMKGCQNMTALSLTSTLNEAAKICGNLQQDGEKRSGGGYGTSKAGRSGEAFCAEIQHRLEECVMEDTAKAKADAASAAKAAALASGGEAYTKETKKGKGGRPTIGNGSKCVHFLSPFVSDKGKGGTSHFLGTSPPSWTRGSFVCLEGTTKGLGKGTSSVGSNNSASSI